MVKYVPFEEVSDNISSRKDEDCCDPAFTGNIPISEQTGNIIQLLEDGLFASRIYFMQKDVIFSGETNPTEDMYDEGDYFLNTITKSLYKKVFGLWEFKVNLGGPPGIDGTDGQNGVDGVVGSITRVGVGIPSNSLGLNNDFYINMDTSGIYHKVSDVYELLFYLHGDKGDKGDKGDPDTETIEAVQALVMQAEEYAAAAELASVSMIGSMKYAVTGLGGTLDSFTLPATPLSDFSVDVLLDGAAASRASYTRTGPVITPLFPWPSDAVIEVEVKAFLNETQAEVFFVSRSAFLAWQTVHEPLVGMKANVVGVEYLYDGIGTGISDMLGWSPFGSPKPEHFLSLGSWTAYSDWLGTTFGMAYTRTATLSMPAGGRMTGPASITKLVGTSSLSTFLTTANDTVLREMTLNLDLDATATSGVYLTALSGTRTKMLYDEVVSSAGILIDPSTGNRNGLGGVFLVSSAANIDGLTVRNSFFTNHFYGFLQANTTVATLKNTTILNSTFDEFGSVPLLFNAPADGALIDNVLVMGNNLGNVRSRQPFGSIYGYPHRASFAGNVKNFRFIGNHGYGYGGEIIRAEENAQNGIILGNTAELNGQQGLNIVANNAGGTPYTPHRILIGDNVIVASGLVAAPTQDGALVFWTDTTVSGLTNQECLGESIVHDNTVSGFPVGLAVHQGSQRDLFHHMILDAPLGIQAYGISNGMSDLMLVDAAVALDARRGGMMGCIHIRSKVKAVPDPVKVYTTSGPASIREWTFDTGRFSVDVGATYIPIIQKGRAFRGRLDVNFNLSDTAYTTETAEVDFNTGSLNYYRKNRYTVGNVVYSQNTPIGIITGGDGTEYLGVCIFNSGVSLVTGASLHIKFTGLHSWKT